MKYSIFLSAALMFLMAACSGGRKVSTTMTEPVSTYQGSPDFTVVYNLPRTGLQFTIETTRTVTRRGPYYQFAEKYLGISGVPSTDYESWVISDVHIHAIEEADPEKYYVLVAKNVHSFAYLNLVKEGFVLPVYQPQISIQPSRFQSEKTETGEFVFTDLGVKRVVVQETQSSMRLMQQDTAFVSVPVLRKEVVRKSLEEKAKEAADFIIDLRMSRFKLISGEYDLFPDGKALEAILKEYKRLEEEYIALFTGKTFKQLNKTVFDYTPSGNEDFERAVLFRFSDNKGILPHGDLSGRPITLEISRENKLGTLKSFAEPGKNDENQNRIYYRVPDVAFIQLNDGRTIITKNRVNISQYGKTLSVPANFRWD